MRLLLVLALTLAFASTAGTLGYEVDATSTELRPPEGASRLVADILAAPPAVTSAGPTPDRQGRAASDPAGQTTSDDRASRSTVGRTMPASAPIRVQIPSIGVDSGLMDLGLQADGTLEVPPNGFPAGWYTGAPTPGELGPAIIAGHVDWGGQPGVFFDLRDVKPGDEIVIDRQDGSTARFRVTHIDQFDKDTFPTQTVYGDLDHAGLRLITCGGSFNPQMRSYDDNLVVFAELIRNDAASATHPGPDQH